MDLLKKSFKYIVVGGGVGVIAYWAYIKVVKYRSNQQSEKNPYSDILDKSLGLDTTPSDSLFTDISCNDIDILPSDDSTIINQSDFAETSACEDHIIDGKVGVYFKFSKFFIFCDRLYFLLDL